MKTPILGSSYVARSVNAADARMVNLFPEIVPEAGKEPAFLNRAPGLKLEVAVGTGPIRGLWQLAGNMYVVSGSQLYKVTPAYVVTLLGTVSGTGPVSMSDNGTQLFVACNGPSYIFNSLTNVFQQITDPDFPGAVTVAYLDGYFVFNEPNSQKIWVTSLLEGTQIDPLDFASAEGSPDGVVGLIADHNQLWVFGTNSIEVWYNSGNADFPFSRIQGGFNELGCAAAYAIAKMDNGLFWLGKDARGQGMVYRANGYSGQRISTHAVEWQIQQYGNLSDTIGYTYQQDGHSFYVLIFPGADTTWVYDVATQAWHERAGFVNGDFTRHRSNCQVFFGTKVLVGDYQNANIYSFDLDDYSDNGSIQKWLRSWRALPTGQNNLKRTTHHSLQLDLETGVGLSGNDPMVPFPPEAPTLVLDFVNQQYDIYQPNFVQGFNPQVMLRWSDDGGHTWSNEHWVSIGKIGEYYRRAIWRRLGMTLKLRDRVYEVSGTDPVKIAIMGAELLISPTNA
jgi:hypothetical protein